MRILFLFVFLSSLLCGKAWAQPRTYPLSWGTSEPSNARTEATLATPYTTTLKLPYVYDFSSRYLHIKKITKGSPVLVSTLRPHGLKTKDSVYVTGSKAPAVAADLEGTKFINRIDDYQFTLYDSLNLSSLYETSSDTTIDYLRITKVGAQETIIPDTLNFYYNHGGVQISTGSALNQPSYYVARFDGLNENGVPYSLNTLAVGYTDSLRSQQFDLSSYTPASSIYMSFQYQHGGLGESPDASDHLYLEFFDQTNTWNVVQDLNGAANDAATFYVAMVPITDAKYLHSKFQYRFRSYGRQSGSYDVWNLDGIYINTGRTAANTFIEDFAIRNGTPTFLKNYTAMPFKHFFSGNNDTTTFFNRNLSTIVTYPGITGKPKQALVTLVDQDRHLISSKTSAPDNTVYAAQTFNFTINSINFFTRNKPLYLDLNYSLIDNSRTDLETQPTFELMFNNVITKRTYLYDYYAYDDSEAEAAFGTNFSGTQIACKFVSEIMDTLTHVDICFARSKGPNLEGSQIYLMVWKDTVGIDKKEIYKKPISIHYQNVSNGFTRYELTSDLPLVLDAQTKYYIGYEQNFPSLLTLGYDRHKDYRDNMFYKESSSWVQMSTDSNIDSGVVMIRPVFFKASNNIPVGVRPSEDNKNGLLLYPNPASSTIDIVATEKVTDLKYIMYSLYGQVVSSGLITSTDHTIDVSQLSTGLYLILCTDIEGRSYSTRFIKE